MQVKERFGIDWSANHAQRYLRHVASPRVDEFARLQRMVDNINEMGSQYAELTTLEDEARTFQRLYVCFRPMAVSRLSLPVLQTDGTFGKGAANNVRLLTLVRLDPDGRALPLAILIFTNKTQDAFAHLFQRTWEQMPNLNQELTVISDGARAIAAAVGDTPWKHALCHFHLKQNVNKAFGPRVATLFTKACFARSLTLSLRIDSASYSSVPSSYTSVGGGSS